MKHILSIQSHVAFGYVGNRSAVFPLQRLSHDVSAINTVQFSNHTGHGKWTGDIFSAKHIEEVYQGIKDLNLTKIDAVISGYLGSLEIGEAILKIVTEQRQANKDFIFSMDPVMGDVGRGFFVREGVAEFFRDVALKEADILCPNHFEFNFLCSKEVTNIEQAKSAILELKKKCSI